MSHNPTLFIGLGGIGCKIVASISEKLTPELKKRVGVIGIDTNQYELEELRENHPDMTCINISKDWSVEEYLKRYPECGEWFPDSGFCKYRTVKDGAGQVRALSRLAGYAAAREGEFQPLLNEMGRICSLDEEAATSGLSVVFVGSIAGGTGAGLFIQMPFFIRKHLLANAGINECVIKGMFVSPDVTFDYHPDWDTAKMAWTNGYASLKELNAFYLHHSMDEVHSLNLKVDFYNEKNIYVGNVPYDYFFLFEKTCAAVGRVGDARLPEVIQYISDIAFTQIFTLQHEKKQLDYLLHDFVFRVIHNYAMKRYAGAGICKLVYPIEAAQQFVALYTAREIIGEKWLAIDRKFEADRDTALTNKKTDYSVQVPRIIDTYCAMFEKESIGEKGATLRTDRKFAELTDEAYFIDLGTGTYTSQAERYINVINDKINMILESDYVTTMVAACKASRERMKTFTDARYHIQSVWSGMQKFSETVGNLITSRPAAIIYDMFPMDVANMENGMNNEDCIYRYLSNVHPIVARFFIYDSIKRLEEIIEECKEVALTCDLYAYKQVDYNATVKGIQTPAEELEIIRKARGRWKDFLFISEESDIKKLADRFITETSSYISSMEETLEKCIKYNVAVVLKERLINLGEKYKQFFDTIAINLKASETSLSALQDIEFPFGQSGVYCSARAFRNIADSFLKEYDLRLSSEVKKKIFDQIFLIIVEELRIKKQNSNETISDIEKRNKKIATKLSGVYQTAILDGIKTDVISEGAGTVNLTVLEALEKEYKLVYTDEEISFDKYVEYKINGALTKASPLIRTGMVYQSSAIRFIGISPVNAKKNVDRTVDRVATGNFYLPNASNRDQIVIGDEFKDNEITCITKTFDLVIEDLVNYADGSSAQEAYEERVDAIIYGNRSKEGTATVAVNPHISDYWCEEGFIPSMHTSQRLKDAYENIQAFLYGIGYDIFALLPDCTSVDDDNKLRLTWFEFTSGESRSVTRCGKIIGQSFTDLYKSIEYNRRIKRQILKEAKKRIATLKRFKTSQELAAEIMDSELVVDFVGKQNKESTEDKSEDNIFNILLSMKDDMEEWGWVELFDELYQILYDYCATLFDIDIALIRSTLRNILEAIYENCQIASIPPEDRTISQKTLFSNYENMLNKIDNDIE